MSSFTVFPAIDLRAGKIVRLAQGDPDRQTVYGDDPRQQAEIFKAAGAEWVHVINLSGAFNEDTAATLKALEGILSAGLKVEFGGGIRDEETLHIPLEMGVERVFLGTAAIKTPKLVDWAIANYGGDLLLQTFPRLAGQFIDGDEILNHKDVIDTPRGEDSRC